MPTRRPGRRAIIVASIIGLCIILIWAAAFRVLYVKTHPLGAWEESACQHTAPGVPAAQDGGEVLVGVAADVPLPSPGFIYRATPYVSTREVICVFRSSDGALVNRFVLPFPRYRYDSRSGPNFNTPDDSQSGPHYNTPSVMRQAHDTLYVATGEQICAFHITNGSQLWCQARQPSPTLGELVVNDNVLLLNTENTLEALDPSSGALLWHDTINDDVYRSLQGPVIHSFAESNGTIYAEHIDSSSSDPAATNRRLALCARDERTGNPLWCQPLAPSDLSVAGVEVGGGSVFAYLSSTASNQSETRLYALRASDGKLLWQQPLECIGSTAPFMAYSPAADAAGGSSLLVALSQCKAPGGDPPFHNEVLVLRPADGSVQWKSTPASLLDVAVANGIAYLDTLESRNGQSVATVADIRALRLSDASPVWRARISSPVTRLALAGDTLYALTSPSASVTPSPSVSFIALRRTDGGELWQATSCGGQVDPLIWHDRLLGNEHGAPVWCHWPASSRSVYSSVYITRLNLVLP